MQSRSSVYASSLDSFRQNLVRRTCCYKWLVMAISLTGLSTLTASLCLQSFLPFLLLTFFPAIVLVFFAVDLRILQQWQSGVLSTWRDGDFRLDLFISTVRQIPNLPHPTVEAMLTSVPFVRCLNAPRSIRASLVEAQRAVTTLAVRSQLANSVAWAVAAATGFAACFLAEPTALVVWPSLALAACGLRLHTTNRLVALRDSVLKTCREENLDPDTTLCLFEGFSFQGLADNHARRWRHGM